MMNSGAGLNSIEPTWSNYHHRETCGVNEEFRFHVCRWRHTTFLLHESMADDGYVMLPCIPNIIRPSPNLTPHPKPNPSYSIQRAKDGFQFEYYTKLSIKYNRNPSTQIKSRNILMRLPVGYCLTLIQPLSFLK